MADEDLSKIIVFALGLVGLGAIALIGYMMYKEHKDSYMLQSARQQHPYTQYPPYLGLANDSTFQLERKIHAMESTQSASAITEIPEDQVQRNIVSLSTPPQAPIQRNRSAEYQELLRSLGMKY